MSDGRNRGARCAALLAALALSCLAIAAQAPDIALVFVSPEDGGYVSGPTPIRLRVTPDGAAVGSVSVFADGRLVCTLRAAAVRVPVGRRPRRDRARPARGGGARRRPPGDPHASAPRAWRTPRTSTWTWCR